jgi:hypothetical protein
MATGAVWIDGPSLRMFTSKRLPFSSQEMKGRQLILRHESVLGEFATKSYKNASISYTMSVYLSERLHVTTRELLNGFSSNLIQRSSYLNLWMYSNNGQNQATTRGTLHEDLPKWVSDCKSLNIHRSKEMFRTSVTEKYETHFMFNTIFQKIYGIWDNQSDYYSVTCTLVNNRC